MYQEMYLTLFSAITEALAQMEQQNYGAAAEGLRRAQCAAEEIYISGEDSEE